MDTNKGSLKELVDVLERIEDKLLSAIHVKLGIIYLKWSIAMTGFLLLSIVFDLININNILLMVILALYWVLATTVILFSKPCIGRTLDLYIRLYFKEKKISEELRRKYRLIYFTGWILASIIGFILIPLFTSPEYWVVGYPIFLCIGTLTSYLGMEYCFKIYDRKFLVFPALFILSSIATLFIVNQDWDQGSFFSIISSILIFLLISLRYIIIALKY